VLDGCASLRVAVSLKVFAGSSEGWPGSPPLIGANGIALSPDRRTLYWTVATGTKAWSVPTAVLRCGSASAAENAENAESLRNLGVVNGNTDGFFADAGRTSST
jgi:sugar lactone lactonase YvrE